MDEILQNLAMGQNKELSEAGKRYIDPDKEKSARQIMAKKLGVKEVVKNIEEKKPMKPIFENEEEMIKFLKDISYKYEEQKHHSIDLGYGYVFEILEKPAIQGAYKKGYIKKDELETAKEDYNESSGRTSLKDDEYKRMSARNYITLLETKILHLENENAK